MYRCDVNPECEYANFTFWKYLSIKDSRSCRNKQYRTERHFTGVPKRSAIRLIADR